mmetsp:Transcript_48751/g.113829  ORF Transcript_48751/g.113829 Transcript_48751/m.113829 type:complete len:449 (-) Transcript_48751:25-1371(-)
MIRWASPGYIASGWIGLALLRVIGKHFRRKGLEWPWYLYYILWAYMLLFFAMASSLRSALRDMMFTSGWLEPAMVVDYVHQRMRMENDTESFDEWREEDDLGDYPYLRGLSMLCPFFLVATYFVCAWHTWQHLKKAVWQKRGDAISEHTYDTHDRTLRIIMLPLFYGAMSFQGVIRMWGVSINNSGDSNHFSNFALRKRFLTDSYDACFWLADVYESYALFVFSLLVLEFLRQRMNSRIFEAQNEVIQKGNIPRTTESFSELTGSVKILLSQTKGLTILGIKLFCATCAMQAVYGVTVNCAAYYHVREDIFGPGCDGDPPGILQTEKVKSMVHHFFYGAGFVASFAAIGNLIEVERGFRYYLIEFSPIWKFLGTKIIVTIAFLQSMALAACPPFCWWSYTRANLLYASLLCIECFLISVVHLFAWSATEHWYEVYTPLIEEEEPKIIQ